MSIVQTNIDYNSFLLQRDIYALNRKYPFLNVQTVGNSVLKKNIYVIKLGKGPNKVFYSASFHANEWITSVVMMKFIEDYCDAFISDSKLYNYSIRNLFNSSSIYIMPMVNPDGVDLVTNSINSISPAYISAKNISENFPNIPFPSRMESKY